MNLADQLMSAFNQAVRIQPAQHGSNDAPKETTMTNLTQDGDFYPDTKDDTMTDDQPTSPLPDLSRWHPVPVGATVPRGAEVAWSGSTFAMGEVGVIIYASRAAEEFTQKADDPERFTPHPIPAPDPDAEHLAALVNTRANPLSVAEARALIDAIREARR